MIRLSYLLIAGTLLLACAHHTPMASRVPIGPPIRLIEHGTPPAAGTRFAIQFNNEPPIIQVADGRGGPPILYHGHELNPDQLTSIIILKTDEARARFGDQTLDAAILIEFKQLD